MSLMPRASHMHSNFRDKQFHLCLEQVQALDSSGFTIRNTFIHSGASYLKDAWASQRAHSVPPPSRLSEAEIDEYCISLNSVPDQIETWLKTLCEKVKIVAKYFRLATNALFCGCGVHFPGSLEGALKLKEISYIHAEGCPAAEIKHGPLTLVRGFIPVICIAFRSDPAYAQITSNITQLKDAAVVVITDDGNDDFADVASFVIHCPATKLQFEPLVAAIPLQLLAYYIADMRGCSIDQPRNLAKSVTVE